MSIMLRHLKMGAFTMLHLLDYLDPNAFTNGMFSFGYDCTKVHVAMCMHIKKAQILIKAKKWPKSLN